MAGSAGALKFQDGRAAAAPATTHSLERACRQIIILIRDTGDGLPVRWLEETGEHLVS